MKKVLLIFAALLPVVVFAQKVKTVEGTYIYRGSEEMSVADAKRIALERAQLEALAEVFGTNITQHNTTHMSNGDVKFSTLAQSEVKGEWIETLGEPEFQVVYEKDMIVVECHIRGRAREIVASNVDLKVKLLRNGIEDRYESAEFHTGDDLFLSFQSPVDGYLAVYLVDGDGKAFCLLPYRAQNLGAYVVKANKPYVFFSSQYCEKSEASSVDELTMTSNGGTEVNYIYVVFSPKAFAKANDFDAGMCLPRQLDEISFNKWLARVRSKDTSLQVQGIPITIKAK